MIKELIAAIFNFRIFLLAGCQTLPELDAEVGRSQSHRLQRCKIHHRHSLVNLRFLFVKFNLDN